MSLGPHIRLPFAGTKAAGLEGGQGSCSLKQQQGQEESALLQLKFDSQKCRRDTLGALKTHLYLLCTEMVQGKDEGVCQQSGPL